MCRSKSLNVVLEDRDEDHSGTLAVRLVGNESAVSIFADGFGDLASAEGYGCPVFLELYGGKFRLVVFADINREDPTHIIDLSRAQESRRARTPA